MKVDFYRVECKICDPRRIVTVAADAMKITLDVQQEMYEMVATCPHCGGKILNLRRAL